MDRPAHEHYMVLLGALLDTAPPEFTQLSITGGEPTESPYLDWLLGKIDKKRWSKVVLTTARTPKITRSWKAIDHVNFSRNAIDDADNDEIMGDKMPSLYDLTMFCFELNKCGIDVTLSRVVRPEWNNTTGIPFYVDMAKKCYASAVCIRKESTEHGDMSPTPTELRFSNYKTVSSSSCPVCRSNTILFRGIPLAWKASAWDPGDELSEVYELVFHPDGVLSLDWAAKKPVKIKDGEIVEMPDSLIERLLIALERIEEKLDGNDPKPKKKAPKKQTVSESSGSCHGGYGGGC